MTLLPRFDPQQVQIFPYFLRVSPEVEAVFANAEVPVPALQKAKYDPTTLLTIDRLCREHRIDVMHLFCYAASTFGRIVGALRGIPTVIHDFDTQVYFGYPQYLRLADRLLAGRTGRGFAASSFCRDYMEDTRRIPADRLEVLFHVIPERQLELARTLDRAQARARLGWDPDRFVFCAVTKLGPDRGNETLIRAFAEVHQAVPRARLAIVHKPTLYHRIPEEYQDHVWIRQPDRMRTDLLDLIAETGCGEAVELIESEDAPELYYAACDVMVAPFENVRFSSVNLIEAMAYGRPHVVTSLGEPGEIASTWRTGPIVPPGDVDALAKAMLEIERDPGRLANWSDHAKVAARDFTTPAVTSRLGEVYRFLVEKVPPGPRLRKESD
jgi:glycosyltransferase involved in cell wall biosynthesis